MGIVNLKKLAVSIKSIEELRARLNFNIEKNGELIHITRNKPKRSDELCNGGSLYWVINRKVLVRQKILNVKKVLGHENKIFAGILLENKIIKVRPTPMKAFQGWRYYENEDVPPDIKDDGFTDEFNNELNKLGLY